MATPKRRISDWLDSRTGHRSALRWLLEEPLPSGVGWWFTLGSVLLFLLTVQALTGVVLTMYYVPTPANAYDSVRFVMSHVAFGRLVRALHFFGASFIVVAAGLHLLRVLFFGAYKRPREVTWLSGVALLLVILAFALSGYLLTWDQRAYWATVVSINIARSAPFVGPWIADLLRAGSEIGALTLSRWYSAHVILLPAALVALVAGHLLLMRRHGIAGPIRPREGPERPFYPEHAVKDAIVIAVVFGALVAFAQFGRAPLAEVADPADATYIPRPEWYFLGLFQLLKYFPGRLEPIATVGIPGLIVALLFLLPFLDTRPDRRLSARPIVSGVAGVTVVAVTVLTWLGVRDLPATPDVSVWGVRAIGGRALAGSARCTRCHTAGGAASDLATARIARDDQWILGHVSDPEMIAPGLRPPPPDALRQLDARAIVAYVHKLRAGVPDPSLTREEVAASTVFATRCIACHTLDGDGGKDGPDLSREGRKHDEAWLVRWITDPSAVKADTEMPSFGGKLSDEDLRAVAAYLARRK